MSSQFLGKFTKFSPTSRGAVAPWCPVVPRYGDAIGMVQRCLELEPSHYDAKMLMQDLDRLVTSEQPSGHGAMGSWWMVMTGDETMGPWWTMVMTGDWWWLVILLLVVICFWCFWKVKMILWYIMMMTAVLIDYRDISWYIMIMFSIFFCCFLVLEVVLRRRNRRGSGEMPISAVFLEMHGTGSTLGSSIVRFNTKLFTG